MLDPHELYELAPDLPDLDRPVLVQALTGFIDAGSAGRLAREQLFSSLSGEVVASFDVDQLLDYRSRRPVMVFAGDHWESYDAPRLGLHVLRDVAGTPFLVLAGPEPDIQWERFVTATTALVDRLGVRLTVGLNAIPMAVPHTRPIGVTAHGSRKDLLTGFEQWLSRVQVPASAGHLLEHRLAESGHDAMGFAVHVPHYLSQIEHAGAAAVLIDCLARATGLSLPTADLHAAAERVRAEVDEQVAESEEVAGVVRGLEAQYDAFVGARGRGGLLADGGEAQLPTGDELGAELERFLAEQGRPGEGPER